MPSALSRASRRAPGRASLELSRRGLLLGAASVGGLLALAGCSTTGGTGPSAAPTTSVVPRGPGLFVSGSSCIGASNGQFGEWRGKPLQATSTWVDDGSVIPFQQEFGTWDHTIDYSPQYRFTDSTPFSWQGVADGTYDDRFRADLSAVRDAWGDRTAAVNYRFQHEFNGDWYPWAATESTAPAFVAGWRHFADLFHDVMQRDPRFRLVWCANGGTQSQAVRDIRTLWPGDDAVDVVAIDYYDFFSIGSAADWSRQHLKVDAGGGPVGIGAWQLFAADHGKPLALPEWGNQFGDNPLFIQLMHEFLETHRAVTDADLAGGVLYEVYFNQRLGNGTPATKDDFRLQSGGRDLPQRPLAAAKYRELWGDWAAI